MNFLKTWELPHWLTAAGAMFLGAFADTIVSSLQTGHFPQTTKEWQTVLVAGVVAGASVVVGFYRNKPGTMAIPVNRMPPVSGEESGK